MATICGQKTNLSNYEARRAAWQIRCGHDWLSQNKLFMLCSSSKGHDLWSGVVYSPFSFRKTRCKFKQCKQMQNIWQRAVLQGRGSKLYFFKKFLLQMLAI